MPRCPRRTATRALAVAALTVVALTVVVGGGAPPASAVSGSARTHATAAPSCGGTVTRSDGTPWTCTFADDFSGTALDSSKWLVPTTANSGVLSGEAPTLGCYTDAAANVSVGNGVLRLTARKEPEPITCGSGPGAFTTSYTSGEVASAGRFSQTYGRFAVRAQFPAQTVAGLHSALWMWPQNSGGPSGEIDIAEWYSVDPSLVMPTLHYAFDPKTIDTRTSTNTATTWSCSMAGASSGFHEYAVEWTSSRFVFRYDGRTCLTTNVKASGTSPFDQPFFLALTQALGGGDDAVDPDDAPLPGTTQIDWVRAWK